MEMIAAGKTLEMARKSMEKEEERVANENALHEQNFSQEYQYVFYERAVKSVSKTVSDLLEIIVANDIEIDDAILSEANRILVMMEWVLLNEGEDNGS